MSIEIGEEKSKLSLNQEKRHLDRDDSSVSEISKNMVTPDKLSKKVTWTDTKFNDLAKYSKSNIDGDSTIEQPNMSYKMKSTKLADKQEITGLKLNTKQISTKLHTHLLTPETVRKHGANSSGSVNEEKKETNQISDLLSSKPISSARELKRCSAVKETNEKLMGINFEISSNKSEDSSPHRKSILKNRYE